MSQLHFECHFKSPEMRSLDLPVEVRKPNLALVARSVISRTVEVLPGTYYVSIKMPAGQELLQEVKLGKRSKTVSLTPEPEDEAPDAAQEVLHFLQEPIETEGSPQPIAAKVRGFSSNMLMETCNEINTEGWHLRSSRTDDLVQLNANGGDAVQLLQLLQPGQPAINFALPVSSKSGCTVVFQRLPHSLTVLNIHLNNWMADLLLQYREQGYIQQALTTATSNYLSPEKLLAGDTQDAIAAAVKAYTLLRFGELEELNDWTEKLKNQFTWLPDGIAIRGEHLARLGEHEQALTVFLEMPSRGLPIFSDGFSYVIDRLRLYISVGESHFEASQLAQARELLERLQRFATFADFTKPLLTFTGIDPLKPNIDLVNNEEIESCEGLDIAEYSMLLEKEFSQFARRFALHSLVSDFQEAFVGVGYITRNKKNANEAYLVEFQNQQTEINPLKIDDELVKNLKIIFHNLNLDSYTQAIKEIRQIISDKRGDLGRSKKQWSSEAENVEFENYTAQLDKEIAKLEKNEKRIQDTQQAINWLDPTRLNPVTQKNFLADLAKEACEAVLENYPGLINLGTAEGLKSFTQFRLDIKNFLLLIHGCLLLGKPDLLAYALREKKLPNPKSPLPTTAYAAAFIFIRDRKVKRAEQGISEKPAEELKTYLNYLINNLNSTI